eukprot:SAG22_NODE_1744_length_3669_cov_2.358543_1_plen_54_part_10
MLPYTNHAALYESSLTSLTELGLNENQITDIAPLSALTSLTSLHLGDMFGGNQI